ncbi:hypothetical protein [Lysobacter sp. FW306-1B-D06B]|uniref:hypothetical protein n=1 Tax=Lysobacter sp. FW306-1B-D06B TaxID=3140250 RepID=UPI0031401F6C
MLTRYSNAFRLLSRELQKLKDERDDMATLRRMQDGIAKYLRTSERGVVRARARLKETRLQLRTARLSGEDARRAKLKIRQCEDRIDQYRSVNYFLKCFGDAIAFLYLDAFALKHTFYKTDDYTVREEPGFISESAGFPHERAITRQFLRNGIPALQCDLTNVIRYGDVCILTDSDPCLVEVKSSGNQNARTVRQQENMRRISDFFTNDGASDFRGTKSIVRQALHASPVTHAPYMNDLIRKALADGIASGSPEHGLLYVAIRTASSPPDGLSRALDGLCKSPCVAFDLNEAKNSRSWLPLYPFTLSLEEEHVIRFILGEVVLLVVIDLAALKWHFSQLGARSASLGDGPYVMQVVCNEKDPSQGMFRISRQMFSRIALEFWSLRWFAAEQATLGQRAVDKLRDCMELGVPMPTDWVEVEDGHRSRPSKEGLRALAVTGGTSDVLRFSGHSGSCAKLDADQGKASRVA